VEAAFLAHFEQLAASAASRQGAAISESADDTSMQEISDVYPTTSDDENMSSENDYTDEGGEVDVDMDAAIQMFRNWTAAKMLDILSSLDYRVPSSMKTMRRGIFSMMDLRMMMSLLMTAMSAPTMRNWRRRVFSPKSTKSPCLIQRGTMKATMGVWRATFQMTSIILLGR
jgi:hypothetical protein